MFAPDDALEPPNFSKKMQVEVCSTLGLTAATTRCSAARGTWTLRRTEERQGLDQQGQRLL